MKTARAIPNTVPKIADKAIPLELKFVNEVRTIGTRVAPMVANMVTDKRLSVSLSEDIVAIYFTPPSCR